MRDKIGLRALEAVAISTTTLAFAITILLVTTGRAIEANPIAAEMLGSFGWTATGVVAVTTLAAAFGVLRWVESTNVVQESEHVGLWLTRGAGVALAGAGIVDVAANVYLLTTVDVVARAFWVERYGLSALVVAVAGLLVYGLPSMRRIFEGCSVEQSPISRQKVVTGAFALLLVFSMPLTFTTQHAPIEASHNGTARAEISGSLFVATDEGDLHALNPSDGSEIWKVNHWNSGINDVVVSPSDEAVYAAYSNGDVKKIDGADGSVIWSAKPHSETVRDLGLSPDEEMVYSAADDDSASAINADDGSVEWSATGFGSGVRDVMAGPDGEFVYASSPGMEFRKVSASDGSQIWSVSNGYDKGAEINPEGDRIYIGGIDDTFRKVDAGDGSQIWSTPVDGKISGTSLHESSGTVYTTDHNAWRFDTTNGTRVWKDGSMGGSDLTVGRYGETVYFAEVNVTARFTSDDTKKWSTHIADSDTETLNAIAQSDKLDTTNQPASKHAFTLDDRTQGGQFSADPVLISYEGESTASNETDTTGFNHNSKAFTDLEDGQRYDIAVYDTGAYYERVGLVANSSDTEHKLTPGINESTETETVTEAGTGTPTLDDRLDVRLDDLEGEIEGLQVTMESQEPVTEFNYTIEDPDTGETYNRTHEFDDPRDYYEGVLEDNVTENVSSSDTPSLDYSGVYENGTAFNGTTDLSQSFDSGSILGPTGTNNSGGSTGSTVAGVAMLGGVAYLAYRRFGNGQLTDVVSRIAP